jgi:hypothetical protein
MGPLRGIAVTGCSARGIGAGVPEHAEMITIDARNKNVKAMIFGFIFSQKIAGGS